MLIDFSTNVEMAINYPPIPAKKLIPTWYKDVPPDVVSTELAKDAKFRINNNLNTTKTIKGCQPVLDYMSTGYIIRAHAQILITPENLGKPFVDGQKDFWWQSTVARLEAHAYTQCPVTMDGNKNRYMKYMNPWIIKVPVGYSCMFYQPHYFLEERFKFMPGIVDCDTYDTIVTFPGYIKSKETFIIEPGDPLVVVVPFKRESWGHTITKLTDQEMQNTIKKSKLNHYMFEGYKKLFHKKKDFN